MNYFVKKAKELKIQSKIIAKLRKTSFYFKFRM